MTLSVFDIFKIGIGPSSSHTVGPMRAAKAFAEELHSEGLDVRAAEIYVRLYGSLALTGAGHATDTAVILGLTGADPSTIDPDAIAFALDDTRTRGRIRLAGGHELTFDEPMHVLFMKSERLPGHSNGMRFTALASDGSLLRDAVYYSTGGGFIVRERDSPDPAATAVEHRPPYPFSSSAELLARCDGNGLTIPELVLANECSWRDGRAVRIGLLDIWNVMQACAARGFRQRGVLPGVLKVPRRAPAIHDALRSRSAGDALAVMDWVNVYAMAVNEENAAGGRVVTAPTNGAAGVVPAVLHYYQRFAPGADDDGIVRFLLTAGAIAMLYKKNASISGAEMGCQGEVGVACSMAAGGLVAALRGSNGQIENAAEIGMEHNLGLTCDPVAGLVQIPCIERNAIGAVKAINAARLAMHGDGSHKVSLDQVIATMRQTGRDMSSIYKETSQGGLAVNVPEC